MDLCTDSVRVTVGTWAAASALGDLFGEALAAGRRPWR